jgi:hypothetical protein
MNTGAATSRAAIIGRRMEVGQVSGPSPDSAGLAIDREVGRLGGTPINGVVKKDGQP